MTDKKLSAGEVERAVARTAPDHIYLVIGGECPDEANFSELEEVTWCEDDVDGNGIQYVRATLSQQPECGKAQSPDAGALVEALELSLRRWASWSKEIATTPEFEGQQLEIAKCRATLEAYRAQDKGGEA